MFKYGKIFILILITMALCFGCGGKQEVKPEKETTVSTGDHSPPTEVADDYDAGEDEYAEPEETGEPQDGDDLGESCKGHEYIVAAGSSVNLDFQVLMKREVILMDAYEKDRFNPEDVTVTDGTDYWIKHNIQRSEPSWEVETVDTSTEFWGVQATELIEKQAARGGKLTSISRSYNARNQYMIKISEEGYGFFTQLGNRHGEKNIAGLSEDEVYETLGDKMEIEHVNIKSGNTILPVELIPVDSESYILNITLDITFPDDVRTNLNRSTLTQTIKIGNSTDASFTLRINYNKKKKMFRVLGPWDDAGCI